MEEIATLRSAAFAITLNCAFLFLRESLSAMWKIFAITLIMIIYETNRGKYGEAAIQMG
jgi:hypothetical protein